MGEKVEGKYWIEKSYGQYQSRTLEDGSTRGGGCDEHSVTYKIETPFDKLPYEFDLKLEQLVNKYCK